MKLLSRQFEVVAKRLPHFVTRSRVLYCLKKYKFFFVSVLVYCSPTVNYTDLVLFETLADPGMNLGDWFSSSSHFLSFSSPSSSFILLKNGGAHGSYIVCGGLGGLEPPKPTARSATGWCGYFVLHAKGNYLLYDTDTCFCHFLPFRTS